MHKIFQMGLSIACNRFHSNQHAHLKNILKENKTDAVICLHFGVHGYICSHMIRDFVSGTNYTSLTS